MTVWCTWQAKDPRNVRAEGFDSEPEAEAYARSLTRGGVARSVVWDDGQGEKVPESHRTGAVSDLQGGCVSLDVSDGAGPGERQRWDSRETV